MKKVRFESNCYKTCKLLKQTTLKLNIKPTKGKHKKMKFTIIKIKTY